MGASLEGVATAAIAVAAQLIVGVAANVISDLISARILSRPQRRPRGKHFRA